MGDGFRGVSADRDGRFKIAERKLMAKMKFPPEFAQRVDMTRVHLEVLRPWVAKKVTGYLGMEDDIIINMVMAELEKESEPDPRSIQINLTGFLERNTGAFMAELWKLLLSAQENWQPGQKGIPTALLKEKEDEIKRINQELQDRARKIAEEQERAKERDKDKERERREREMEWERERERERERAREWERERERERQREWERQREAERQRDSERQRESNDRDRELELRRKLEMQQTAAKEKENGDRYKDPHRDRKDRRSTSRDREGWDRDRPSRRDWDDGYGGASRDGEDWRNKKQGRIRSRSNSRSRSRSRSREADRYRDRPGDRYRGGGPDSGRRDRSGSRSD